MHTGTVKRKLAAMALSVLVAVGCAQRATSRTGPDAGTIVARMSASGLPVTDVTVYNGATDPNRLLGRPGQYVSKANWDDPRDTGQGTYTVETFADSTSRDARAHYAQIMSSAISTLGDYVYVDGLAVMRIDYHLTADQAHAYDEAFVTASSAGRR